jgi:superfamily II DNA or RNA helicase
VLESVRRTSKQDLSRALGPSLLVKKEKPEDDLSLATDSKLIDRNTKVQGLLPEGTVLQLELAAQLAISLDRLPSKLVAALQRLATFANPEFFKLQRMRMATYPHQRFIFSGEKRSDVMLLPRGLIGKVQNCLEQAGAKVAIRDRRMIGCGHEFRFEGALTDRQQTAVDELLKSDSGIFVALPGIGKTVIACALIAERKTSTLVLVHKQPLADQWRNEICATLGLTPKQIGTLSGSKRKRTGIVDIAMLQSLARSQDCTAILAEYGFVVIDECHHIPAASFESIMKQCAAKYILGLTATPRRKDGLEVLLFQQCGPVRHEIKRGEVPATPGSVRIRETGLEMPDLLGANPPYHLIAEVVATDVLRNRLIATEIAAALQMGRFPVVLADRREQVGVLEDLVMELADPTTETYRLEGPLSAKGRRQVLSDVMRARGNGKPVALFATASLVGEGFNLPELDALFLASPISFEGRLVQYVGRLQRVAVSKLDVVVFDYLDSACPVLLKMCRGRIKAYQKLGFEIVLPESLSPREQPNLF